jgi:hypothetical protein
VNEIPTPRTDYASVNTDAFDGPKQAIKFARQLERELTRALRLSEDNGKLAHTTACELAEALEELKKANQYIANGRSWNAPDSLLAEMSMIKQQRDTLAEACAAIEHAYLEGSDSEWGNALMDIRSALAAVKGGSES